MKGNLNRARDWKLGGLILLLGGCASYGPQISTFDEVSNALAVYAEQPVEKLAQRFGIPHQQTEFMGQRVFIWHTDRQWTRYVPTTSTTTGTVGGLAGVPYAETTRSEQRVTSQWHCALEVTVDPQGLVSQIGLRGNQGACSNFMP